MPDIDDSPVFVRQRRNLILASLALAFAQSTHLKVEHVSLFGITGRIDEPVSTIPYLGILCGYFLWRYWQAFTAETRPTTKTRYKESKKRVVQKIAVKIALAPYEGMDPPVPTMEGARVNGRMPHDEEELTPHGASVLIVTNIVGDPGTAQKNITVELRKGQLLIARIKAVLHLVFISNEISEYYLPLAMPAIPLGILAWQLARPC